MQISFVKWNFVQVQCTHNPCLNWDKISFIHSWRYNNMYITPAIQIIILTLSWPVNILILSWLLDPPCLTWQLWLISLKVAIVWYSQKYNSILSKRKHFDTKTKRSGNHWLSKMAKSFANFMHFTQKIFYWYRQKKILLNFDICFERYLVFKYQSKSFYWQQKGKTLDRSHPPFQG